MIDAITETEDKWIGEIGVALKEVLCDVNGSINALIPENRKIMFFGDSITEGIRALNMNATADGNSAINAFPFIASQYLWSNNIRVGFGASGVTKGGSGGIPKLIYFIDNITSTRLVDSYNVDIIIINMGTNDVASSSNIFQDEYTIVLNRLTIKYPGVHIFVVIPFNQIHALDIRILCKNFEWVHVVETVGWEVTFMDGTHPDANGAKIAGINLSNAIISILGKQYFLK